jgi:hypothetical protein
MLQTGSSRSLPRKSKAANSQYRNSKPLLVSKRPPQPPPPKPAFKPRHFQPHLPSVFSNPAGLDSDSFHYTGSDERLETVLELYSPPLLFSAASLKHAPGALLCIGRRTRQHEESQQTLPPQAACSSEFHGSHAARYFPVMSPVCHGLFVEAVSEP